MNSSSSLLASRQRERQTHICSVVLLLLLPPLLVGCIWFWWNVVVFALDVMLWWVLLGLWSWDWSWFLAAWLWLLQKGSSTVAHSPNAADKDQEQRGNGHSHHGHHHHHHHHNHTSSTSSHGTAVTTPTTPTAAAAQTTPKRRQHQCSSHKHATTPTTTRFDGAPVLRSSLRRTSGNLRECDRVSTHLSILLLLLLPGFLIFTHLLLTKFPSLQACGRNPFAHSAAAAAPEFLIIVSCSTKWVESGGFSLAEPGSVWQCSTTSSGMVWEIHGDQLGFLNFGSWVVLCSMHLQRIQWKRRWCWQTEQPLPKSCKLC